MRPAAAAGLRARWRERIWKLLFFAALLGVTWLFLTPSPPKPGADLPLADKLYHVVLFAGLALLAGRAYTDKPRWGIFAALVVYGLCIELGQWRTGRSPEALDVLADAVGALAVHLSRR